MVSNASILRTIDNIILRTNEVKVCQDHLKLIATRLTRLQNALTNDNSSYENVEHILKAIDEVITSCSENETNLNGVTYKDLQSLLVRLQLRLAEHEANMTTDDERKIQILSQAYYELNSVVEKVSDETTKQRLDEIERYTKEKTAEKLRLFREKYTGTIESYLRSCIELHKSVSLADLTTDTVAKITHTFYQTLNEDQLQLEHNWQTFELPLTRTFIKFKSDKSTAFERNEQRRLPCEPDEENSKGIWQRVVSAPYMVSIVDKNRYLQEDDVSEENIIRTKRWIVILGDPGSGKTSFSRWLVRHLAQTLLLNDQHSTDYGPLRIPILIRIGEFAEMLKQKPSLTLFDYIGKHKWMGKSIIDDLSISLDNLSYALQDYIKCGHAMIILDGLDEIPVSDLRSKIIKVVEKFVDNYVQIPSNASLFDNPQLTRLLDNPCRSGGNQLVVTSRIVGYHAAPLAGQFSHYTIRPMDMEHIKDFINYWFFHAHQRILDTYRISSANQGEKHGEALKKEIDKPANVGLLDIASNPSLLSFLCNMALNQVEGLPLPTERIRLFEHIVNSMLDMRSSRASRIPKTKLIRMLSDIAYYIHTYSTSNFINEDQIKDACSQSVKAFQSKIILVSEDIEDQASKFARTIREDAGVFTIQGKSLYGFLHFPFQEYFTSLKLIEVGKFKQKKFIDHELHSENEVQLIVQSLRYHAKNPRFRVPNALALGKISLSWSQKDFDDFCYAFIQAHDESDSLLPFGAYMLVIFNNELVNYPSNGILFDALDRLILAASRHKWSIICPYLLDQIADALRQFRHGIVSLWIENFLKKSSSHDIQTISALCHLIEGKSHEFENIKWLNQASCSMLQSFSIYDNETNEFAIDRLLVKVAFSNHQLLPVLPTTFKAFLIEEEIQPNSIPIVLFPLIITLYGGLRRDGQTIVFDTSYIHRESSALTSILIRFLSIKDRTKQDQALKKLKQDCIKSFLARIENQDESCETIDLCIATVCLYDIDYVHDNRTIIPNSILRLTTNRLKYISMILRQLCFTSDENDRLIENEITKFISIAIDKFQYGDSARVQFLDFLDSLRSGVARLRCSTTSTLLEGQSRPYQRLTLHLPNSFRKEDRLLNGLLSTDTRFPSDRNSCSLLHHFTKLFWILEHNDDFDTQYRMAVAMDTIPEYLLFRNDEDLLFSFTFVPQHLQNLYIRLLKEKFIVTNAREFIDKNKHHLYFSHILIECLIRLSNPACRRLSLVAALTTLSPVLRIHQLENFGSSLLWPLAAKYSDYLAIFESTRRHAMNHETGQYLERLETMPSESEMIDEGH